MEGAFKSRRWSTYFTFPPLFPRMQNTKNFQKERRRKVPPPNTFFEREENIAPTSLFPYPRRLLHPALHGRKNIHPGIEFPIRCGKSSVALYRLRRVKKDAAAVALATNLDRRRGSNLLRIFTSRRDRFF